MLERIGARRVLMIAALGTAVTVGAIAATNLAPNTVYYLTPSEAKGRAIPVGQTVRLGGLVLDGTLRYGPDQRDGRFFFTISDGAVSVPVIGAGAIPGLLRENAGAVVQGSFASDGTFVATQVIAKHDEVYTAPKAGATPAHRTEPP